MNVTKHNMEMHWVTVKEGDGSKQTILCGRVMGAFFVHGEVEFELGALELLRTIKRCTSWKRALVLIAVVRRRPRGGLARKFQLFQSLTVARAWDGKKQL